MKISKLYNTFQDDLTKDYVNILTKEKVFNNFVNEEDKIIDDGVECMPFPKIKSKENLEKYYQSFKVSGLDSFHLERKFRIMNFFLNFFKLRTVLDYGFGPGYYTYNLAINNYKVDCIDFEHGNYRTLNNMLKQSDINFGLYNLTEDKFDKRNTIYDAVLSIEVLEHIEDPLPVLEYNLNKCKHIFFLEEYCGVKGKNHTADSDHIAPPECRIKIYEMLLDYGFKLAENPWHLVPQVFIKNLKINK